MPVTVAQILKLDCLSDARVLAGSQGLARPVSSVTVGEVPDIAEWLSGGEIVLSTMFALINDVARQRDFCQRIMAAGASALFVKPKRFVGEFPNDVLVVAEKRGFPIVEVPEQVRWTRIMQEAMEVLINRQATLLEKSQAIHRELLDVVIGGGGWSDLANAAARLTEMPVVILDVALEMLGSSGDFPLGAEALHASLGTSVARAQLEELGGPGRGRVFLALDGGSTLVVIPVVVSHNRLGYVCALSTHTELQEMETVALEHTATIAAVEMARDQVRFETEVRLRGDFVDDLLSGRLDTRDSLLRRASFLGCDLSRGATVLILDVDGMYEEGGQPRLEETEVQKAMEGLFARTARLVREREPGSLVTLKSRRIIVLVVGESAKEPRTLDLLASRIQDAGRELLGHTVWVGLSRYTPEPTGLATAFAEAVVALKVGHQLAGPDARMHFDKVGTYKLLLSLWEHDPGSLRALYEETIGPIAAYDRQNATELVKTLKTYFGNDENLTKTAQDLYAHRHTVHYRLQKIADLSGLSVFRTDDKERLSLGLKAGNLLREQ